MFGAPRRRSCPQPQTFAVRSRKSLACRLRPASPDRRSSRKPRRQPRLGLWIRSCEICGLRHESSADRRPDRRAQAPRARIHGLGLANVGPRGSGPAVRTSQLRIPSRRPEGVARSGNAEGHRRGTPRMRRPCGREAEGSHVCGIRCGSVEGGLLGALQEGDANAGRRCAEQAIATGLRRTAARPDRCG